MDLTFPPILEMRTVLLSLLLFHLSSADSSGTTDIHATGGTSISGMSVTCFDKMENCLEACYMSCYYADSCNDSTSPMIACAPGLRSMIVLTLLCVLPICCCCCLICFCTPCCCCAVWLKKRRNARNRRAAERADIIPCPSAPPLLPKV